MPPRMRSSPAGLRHTRLHNQMGLSSLSRRRKAFKEGCRRSWAELILQGVAACHHALMHGSSRPHISLHVTATADTFWVVAWHSNPQECPAALAVVRHADISLQQSPRFKTDTRHATLQ